MSYHARAAPRNGDPYEIYLTALDHGEHDVARGRFSRRGSSAAMNERAPFKFRLYTADHTMNSTEALANLTALCAAYLPDRHEIEVVNVLQNPQRALADRILMTPTLLKFSPFPVRRITGTLSQTLLVLAALGLQSAPA
jgi:circadian clock protein KaiB